MFPDRDDRVGAEVSLVTDPGVGGDRRRGPRRSAVTAATGDCPGTATKLPADGHGNFPVAAMRSARHFIVCLTAGPSGRPRIGPGTSPARPGPPRRRGPGWRKPGQRGRGRSPGTGGSRRRDWLSVTRTARRKWQRNGTSITAAATPSAGAAAASASPYPGWLRCADAVGVHRRMRLQGRHRTNRVGDQAPVVERLRRLDALRQQAGDSRPGGAVRVPGHTRGRPALAPGVHCQHRKPQAGPAQMVGHLPPTAGVPGQVHHPADGRALRAAG